MATKRMLSQHVIVTDDSLRLPPTAIVLYFFLNLTAADDGFNSAPEDVMRRTRSSQDDLRLLIEKRFILAFNSGVVVIRHWLINNTLRKDTYHQTLHEENDQIGVNRAGEYEHLELLSSGEKSLEDYVRINQGQPLSRKKIKEIKQQLLTGESVEFEFDTNPFNVGESREEESRQGESGNVDGIPYNKTHLYGDEQNVLLDNAEIEKIYAKYVNPRKLIEL